MAETSPIKGPLGLLGLVWGLGGMVYILVHALQGLGPRAAEALRMDLEPVHWLFLVPWLVFMGYSEGYRGFQRGFAPRVVVRTMHLAANPRPLWVLIAPLFSMGLVHSTRKRKIVAICLILGITGLVLVVRLLPQPWRGLVDAGVVLGLGWGLAAVLLFTIKALAGNPPDALAHFPDETEPPPPVEEATQGQVG